MIIMASNYIAFELTFIMMYLCMGYMVSLIMFVRLTDSPQWLRRRVPHRWHHYFESEKDDVAADSLAVSVRSHIARSF